MGKFLDLTGGKYGRLVILSRAKDYIQPNGKKRIMWNCMCDCGSTITAFGDNIKKGVTTSCGCYRKECTSKRISVHNDTNTRLYGVWCTMKSRCYNRAVKHYHRYGGRGIVVCDEWKNSFKSFKDWSINNGYSEGLSIDRIDNNGDYSPTNCRWVSFKIQANNRKSNKLLTYKGETHNLTEWAKIININPKTLFSRLYSGWSIERMLDSYKKSTN